MQTKVTFTEEALDETRITIQWSIAGKYSEAELRAFVEERAGMTLGWTGSFDKLEEYIARQV
jgi:hypothetical protein